jgi:hypothetical protein
MPNGLLGELRVFLLLFYSGRHFIRRIFIFLDLTYNFLEKIRLGGRSAAAAFCR